ncbi:hypothetical protein PROFUN_03811 [Planoprotostelium fungivorum]|uniref:Heparan-alpha-glucosaminide N-acetyltransferase catalytic domain-containing protein n=1 Tax=Planoprotostelium fungivorum TaxID=1890364 RepID=A0A2P6NI66_9EUKA|nr:hypothetical protein PROFUN_03811 [Planoprotostelium fungivorum]
MPHHTNRGQTLDMSDTANEYNQITDEERDPLIIQSNGVTRRKSLVKISSEKKEERLLSLDVVRGITIFTMNLVNHADGSYPILEHAVWDGLTLADFVMPFFLFIVGCSIVLSHNKLKKRSSRTDILKKSAVRTVKLIGLGLLLAAIGYIPNIDIYRFRLPGVLQRIAIGYFITVCIELFVPFLEISDERLERGNGFVPPESSRLYAVYYRLTRGPLKIVVTYGIQWLCAIFILLMYLILVFNVDVPNCGRGSLTPKCNAFSYIDQLIVREHHMYQYPTCQKLGCKPFDPEGLLSNMASVVSVIIGLYYGYVLVHVTRPKKILMHWIFPSSLFLFSGLMIHFFGGFPLNKNLYSPSFLFLMAGAAGFFLSIFYLVVDVYRFKKIFMPFIWLGSNSIIIYFLDEAMPTVIGWFCYDGNDNNIIQQSQTWLKDHMGERHGIFFYAMSDTIFWTLVAGVLYYKKIFFKV